ncbi:hypothetical protein LL06_02080 [Hoeflea sp. BAL378]|uniref:IclR family transcriptional regulator n=1 Tax=Hoeflea sp. BAL378 TaxID=1547437 RepID=UPI0005135E24|nr:IclR family transcriptional regulator [Hoeflea sp. BAL378]KGF70893.1 hypothetical protein LL06_02080 [Hoeflea sp. BAL378]
MQNYTVESVDKAFDLLMSVARNPDLGVTELAKQTDMGKSRAYRLLHTMEQKRFVQRSAKGAYKLGDAMLILGITASSQNDLVRLAGPALDDLCRRVNETVLLRVLDGYEALCVSKVEPSRDLRVNVTVGRRRPLYAGSPKCILAFQSPQFIDRCIPQRIPPITSKTPKSRGAVLNELAKIRSQGYCVSTGEISEDQISCAAPIFALDNTAIAAIHVVSPAFRIQDSDLEHIIRVTTSTAAQLSKTLRGELRPD